MRAREAAALEVSAIPAQCVKLLRLGFAIFPVCAKGKEPLTEHGFKDAGRNVNQIATWARQWPGCNWGVALGMPSACFVLDFDTQDGAANFEREHGKLPPTYTVKTGRGAHLYFRLPNNGSPTRKLDGGELRSDGAYAVGEGSIHPSGALYECVSDVVIAEFPPALLEHFRARPVIEVQPDEPILEGQRNEALFHVALGAARNGATQSAVLALLRAENARCVPPLEERELENIARSAVQYAVRKKPESPASAAQPVAANCSTPGWPEPLAPQALHGIAGEVVRAIEPHTEADPAALLVQFLVAFGNAAGGASHFYVEADRHPGNLFAVIVGVTSKARKGTSWGHIRGVFKRADSEWAGGRIASGLSSGEGLIWAVRDQIEKRKPVRERGRVSEYETVVEDEGVADKRLLVIEAEFASPLRVMSRDGNILSAVLRDAWDSGDLRVLTKNSPARATGAHVSILGHVTREELLRYLNSTEASNGFANRFLWACAKRSKVLPEGGDFELGQCGDLIQQLRAASEFAKQPREVFRDEDARAIWHGVYEKLSEGMPGMFGSVTGRAEAQVVRLSLLYALLDCCEVIRREHMLAALAVWDYCEASARYIFGDALGYPDADRILEELRRSAEGLTRTEIRDLFGRHRSEAKISAALASLVEHGLVRRSERPTDGRPVELWVAVAGATKAT